MEGESVRSKRLDSSVWTDIDAMARPRLAVPVGSCEQHGPHLPLDTDTRIARAVAEGLAAATSGVVVAPALSITASGEHRDFAGTLSIGTEALQLVLVELTRSADWSDGVIFVNGHGGNMHAVNGAVTTLQDEGRRVLSWWPHVPGGDSHAGRTETSLMLAIAPELVRLDRIEAGNAEPLDVLLPRLRTDGVRAVSANGVLGDPRGACEEHGHQLLAAFVDDLVAEVGRWSDA